MKDEAFTEMKRLPEGLAAELPSELPPPTLSLIVLQSGDIERAKDFYSLLGLSLAEERHGKGQLHYSATLGELVLEIYPCQGRQPSRSHPHWVPGHVPGPNPGAAANLRPADRR